MLSCFSPEKTSDKKSRVILTKAHEQQTERRAWFHKKENAPATAEVGRRKVALMTLLIGNAGCVKLYDNHPTFGTFFWCTMYATQLLEPVCDSSGRNDWNGRGSSASCLASFTCTGLSHLCTLSYRGVQEFVLNKCGHRRRHLFPIALKFYPRICQYF